MDGENQATVFTVHTDAEFLRGALEPHGIIVAEGTWVTTVNGITADSGKQEWWMLYEGTQPSNYGVDELRIKDGGAYTFVLTVGW